MIRVIAIWIVVLLWAGQVIDAQDLSSPTLTTPKVTVSLYKGPGISYQTTSTLLPGQLVNIVERNRMGDWVKVWQFTPQGTLAIDGWTQTQFLEIRSDLDLFDMVNENQWMLDGDPLQVANPNESFLYSFPIMPKLDKDMVSVFEQGTQQGNNPAMITRVGDSLLMSEWYLLPMLEPTYQLGKYAFLEDDLLWFGKNMHWSIANQRGLNTYTVFDATWADSSVCKANENPLNCEYRVSKPLAAFILFGPNDVKIGNIEGYRKNLIRIVEESLEAGVIPVLMTFSSHPQKEEYALTLDYNRQIIEVATLYHVPLINVWLAMRTLPNYGLDQDLVHLKAGGYPYINFEGDVVETAGVQLLNLLSLRFMHELTTSLDLLP